MSERRTTILLILIAVALALLVIQPFERCTDGRDYSQVSAPGDLPRATQTCVRSAWP